MVFLDEPTRGIDVGAKLEVYELINRLTDPGQAVVLVSSELPELMGMSDRIIMLAEGRVGGTFTRAEATQEKLLAAAMGHHVPSGRLASTRVWHDEHCGSQRSLPPQNPLGGAAPQSAGRGEAAPLRQARSGLYFATWRCRWR